MNHVNIATGIDEWNGDLEHAIDGIPDFTKQTLEISGIKLVDSKIPWLLKCVILPCVRVAVIGVLIVVCKLG